MKKCTLNIRKVRLPTRVYGTNINKHNDRKECFYVQVRFTLRSQIFAGTFSAIFAQRTICAYQICNLCVGVVKGRE